MARSFTNIIPTEDIAAILSTPAVQAARATLEADSGRNVVYTGIPVPAATRQALRDTLGLNLEGETVPMRWIRGDTPAHVDVGRAAFENTYLAYLTDSPGELVVDGNHYPIDQGSAYVFHEGMSHETTGTGSEPRLLLGPMSERGFAVGAPVLYYSTKAAAEADIDYIGGSGFTIIIVDGISSWRIASNSTGTSSQATVYNAGDILNNDGQYYLYPEETNTCCQAALDLKGIDYTTRAQTIAGILTAAGPRPKGMSYSQYLNIKKAISAKRR
jgi:hypothetical protein